MQYRVDVQDSDGSTTSQKFATYDAAADYVAFVFDASAEDEIPPRVKIRRDVPGAAQAVTDGNPGGISMGNVIDRTIGSTDHQFVIEQSEYGYLARYGNKSHFGGVWNYYPAVEFPTHDEAVAYAERFLAVAEENVAAAGITEGNPGGISDGSPAWTSREPTAAEIAAAERVVARLDAMDKQDHKVTLNSGEVVNAPSAAAAAQIAEEERAMQGDPDRDMRETIEQGNPDGIGNRYEIVEVPGGYKIHRDGAPVGTTVHGRYGQAVNELRLWSGGYYDRNPADGITEGNPDGIGSTADLDAAIIANRENPSLENEQRVRDAAAAQTRRFHEDQTQEFMARTTADGNPGGEPLHESLSEVAAQIDYEAEVVAAAAEEIESPEISEAGEKQAEAMDDAAEAVADAAEVAAETAAEVFTETGVATAEVAETDTPEGEVVSGHAETTPDIPPEPMHWYRRRIGGHR